MLFFGATAIILIYTAVNKANHWPKACHIPVRYVALFSLQLVVIQPFPLDLLTTTNNNNINISRKMANGEQGEATSLYISCMMTIGVLRMQSAQLVRLIMERRRRRRRIMENLIQTNNMLLHFATVPQRSQRTVWMKSRNRVFWERDVLTLFDDEDWKANFRMTRKSFNKLCGIMEGVMKPEKVTVRAPIPLEMRVAIVLYKLASCAEYRVVANQFGVHRSTVKKMVYQFCNGMVTSALGHFIKVPTTEEAIGIATRFEQKFNIPQIIGCIDGTHIPVLPPSDGYKDFVNRKGWPSYVLQGVVDDMYR